MIKGISFILSFFMGLALIINAHARQPSGLEKKELVLLVNNITDAVAKKDFSVMVNTMPARLYKEMAIRMHTTEVVLREDLKKQLTAQFNLLIENGYKLDSQNIEYKETSDGTFYGLIPTRIETTNEIVETTTLAIFDNTKWHVILGGQRTVQNSIFLQIYPSFENISIPLSKITKK